MKRILLICLAMVLIFISIGCEEDRLMATLASMAATEVGCTIKQSGDVDTDRALRDLHIYALTGEIPQDALDLLNERLAKHMDARPTLPAQITNLATLLGADVDPETNKIIGIVEVSPAVLAAVGRGYISGFNICEVK